MQTLFRAPAALAVLLTFASAAATGPMTAGDRQRLAAHLEMTESWLASEVERLSEAQLRFRASPGTWSIKDIVEHLGIAEPQSRPRADIPAVDDR